NDEFMKAVEAGGKFGLRARMTGEVIEEVEAKAECVPPGPAAAGCPAPVLAADVRPAPADIADRIRHLGALHDAGLLTDAEFSHKKAELLAEL
ncbi:SHOCT domain-containing protein, partial [Streptomyces sp. NPDC048845]|uniref:SHOCT domain-containing protein n=1 Tax=Streptomyces sp. NPDC048845 TaxID=3155390 RepID=UPI0034133410